VKPSNEADYLYIKKLLYIYQDFKKCLWQSR